MTAAPALEARGLEVAFGGFRALDNLSFRVGGGEIAAIIGPNGAGKTTCFNAICGFVPARGDVLVHGRPVRGRNPHAAWRAGIARTFQRLELYLTLTVRERIALAGHCARSAGRPAHVDSEGLLELVGLREVGDELVMRLPLGQGRLVELARALATGGDVLLLDESSSGLDRRETEAFAERVRHVQQTLGHTVVLIEHDMTFVRSLATHLLVLDFGQVIADGPTADVLADPRVHEVYLGAPAAAQVAG